MTTTLTPGEGITVSCFRGELDAVPVVQIDTGLESGRLRINLNDGPPLFDGDPERTDAFKQRTLVHNHDPYHPQCQEFRLADGSLLGRCMLPWSVADGELTPAATAESTEIDVLSDPRVEDGAKLRAVFDDETEITGFVKDRGTGLTYAGDDLVIADCTKVTWHLLAEAPHPDKPVLDVLSKVMGGRGLGVKYEGFLAELRTNGLKVEMENTQ